jgi:hypothetical protein
VIALGAIIVTVQCSNSTGPGGAPQYVYDGCVAGQKKVCELTYDCAGAVVGKLAFPGTTSAADCETWAKTSCDPNSGPDAGAGGGEDTCPNPTYPSESDVNACVAEINKLTCSTVTTFYQNPPAACVAALADPCPDSPDPDSTVGPNPDGGPPVSDKGQPPVGDVFVPPSNCPYTAPSFSCQGACDNLWKLVKQCASDPNLPANLATVLQAMSALPEKQALATCKLACEATSGTAQAQWSCFQAAPTSDCTKIAGCTSIACP